MSFLNLKTRLRSLINRKDCTDELAGTFVKDAIADLERMLRIGPMETVVQESDWNGVQNALILPAPYLETINLFTDAWEMTQVDMATFLASANDIAIAPTMYVRMGDRFLLRPTPTPGTTVYLHCYSRLPTLNVDTDENVWTRAAINAVVYRAAAFAADHFQMEDEHSKHYQARAENYVTSLSEQDLDEKWSGRLSIPPTRDAGHF